MSEVRQKGKKGKKGQEITIELAGVDDLARLPEIERRAARLFSPDDLPPECLENTIPPEAYREAQQQGRVFVARDSNSGVVGLALVAHVDGHGHLEEVDVEPAFGRQGIGRRLVERACGWAHAVGYDHITLSTFREVPWNGPFYARLGFIPLPLDRLGPGLQARRENEAQEGFDLARRFIMMRSLERTRASELGSRSA